MVKLRKNRRLCASSIIEVTTAMVLNGIVFTIAIMIYLNISSAGYNFQNLKYKAELKNIAREIIREKDFLTETIIENNVIIEKDVHSYQSNPSVLVIKLSAWVNEKKVADYKTLIYEPEN